jgi:carboxyl-terminal processing protease
VSTIELLVASYAAVGTLILAVVRRIPQKPWRWIAIVGGVLSVAGLAMGGDRIEAIPMTCVALIVAALALRRSRRQLTLPSRPRIVNATLRYVAALLVLSVVVINAALIEILDPLTNTPFEDIFLEPPTPDFSHLPWPDAFDKLHSRLSRAYAFGDWKRIDWKQLHDAAAPKIAEASRNGDRDAYYTALLEYLWAIKDGHVDLSGPDGGLHNRAVGGGFGLSLIRLDDRRSIAHVLIKDGPAARQGVQWGATVLEWNGVPIDEAVANTAVLWDWGSAATNEGAQLTRMRLLTRAPVGSSATVLFRNPDETATRKATLVAVNDGFETMNIGRPASLNLKEQNINWRMLPEKIGYLKIRAEFPTLPQLLPDRVVRRAVTEFIRAGAKGIVIDVRGNPGGADKLVPRMMGFFFQTRQFYEHTTLYNEARYRFERQPAGTLWIEPLEPLFTGPIAVLVDEWCVSSCEGIALIALRRPGGHVLGFHRTHGSFGMSGAELRMPEGLTVEYPAGQSLDENGIVQIDSDWRLEGGVPPDIRVPLTMETVRAQFKDGRDVVLETAVHTLTVGVQR